MDTKVLNLETPVSAEIGMRVAHWVLEGNLGSLHNVAHISTNCARYLPNNLEANRLILCKTKPKLAACNRQHEIDQRLVRWLLMCQDRICSDLLPMTHEFFAEMLGTGRPSVSLAAAVLQRAGFIQYARGAVKITNRKGLEEAACECYGVIRQLDDNPNISPNILG